MQLAQMQASMMQALVQPQWPQAYDGEPLLQPLGQHAPPSASAPVPTVVAQAAQGCEPAPDGTGNIQEQCPGGLRPAEYRSRSRTPPPQVAPSTPEVPSPEALALDSPEMPAQPLEPPTPEVLRRPLTIAKEGDRAWYLSRLSGQIPFDVFGQSFDMDLSCPHCNRPLTLAHLLHRCATVVSHALRWEWA